MRIIGWGIDLFLIYWLFTATTAIIPLLVLGGEESLASEGNAFLRLLIVPSLIMMPLLVLSRARDMTALLLRNPLILLLLVWVWLSVSWSMLPDISARRALSLTVYTLLACYLVLRYDMDRILRILSWMILALLVVSVAFALLLPGLSAMPDERGLRGIFTHKNGMGEFLVLALVILPPAIRQGLIPKSLGWIGVLLALALLPVVNSATAIVVAIGLVGVYAVLALFAHATRPTIVITTFGLSACLFLALALIANIDAVLGLIGRDQTFTGRDELWAYVWGMIERQWLLGYGYEAFWEVEAFAKYAADSLLWDVPNAHNGYLDTVLGLGVIGLFILLALFLNAAYRIVLAFNRSILQPAGILLGLVGTYAFRALAESNLLGQNSIMWVLIVAFTVALTPGLARIRAPSPVTMALPDPEPDPCKAC